MEYKVCSKCGWKYSKEEPRKRCRFCGTVFTEGTCRTCGTYGPYFFPQYTLCKTCYQTWKNKKRVKLYYENKRKAELDLQAWVDALKKIPKDTPTLTEAEWLDTCNYFKRCVKCGEEEISARSYFIPFSLGGKYVKWNIIPTCEKCANRLVTHQINPFILSSYVLETTATKQSEKYIRDAVEYLWPIVPTTFNYKFFGRSEIDE